MPSVKEKHTEQEICFLSEIYKNTKMGADAIINLLPHVKEDAMRTLMTRQLDGYEKYAARAAKHLEELGEQPREESLLTRWFARIGMAWGTMLDSTTSHIAEMMVKGSNMGITDMTKLLNAHADVHAQDAARLANEVISFEEHNLECMRRYL